MQKYMHLFPAMFFCSFDITRCHGGETNQVTEWDASWNASPKLLFDWSEPTELPDVNRDTSVDGFRPEALSSVLQPGRFEGEPAQTAHHADTPQKALSGNPTLDLLAVSR